VATGAQSCTATLSAASIWGGAVGAYKVDIAPPPAAVTFPVAAAYNAAGWANVTGSGTDESGGSGISATAGKVQITLNDAIIAAINASAIPAVGAECTSIKDIDASRSRWEMVRSQPAKPADKEKTCRAYATSFYESVTTRQAAVGCTGGADISSLDSEINAFNDLLATKCGG